MMDRREFMTSMAAAVGLPSVPGAVSGLREFATGAGVAGKTNRRPKNVILMICDDLGYGDLGCYGGTIPTPNLDALAAGGIRLTHFNAAHPICSASRGALLAGGLAHLRFSPVRPTTTGGAPCMTAFPPRRTAWVGLIHTQPNSTASSSASVKSQPILCHVTRHGGWHRSHDPILTTGYGCPRLSGWNSLPTAPEPANPHPRG